MCNNLILIQKIIKFMKTKKSIIYSIIASLLISLVLFSCNDDDDPGVIQQGEVEFGFSLKDITDGNNKSAKADVAEPAALIVSIVDAGSNLVYDTEEIELYNMNGSFISKPLSLLVGSYTLEKFLVVDADGNVIYASPLEGSDLAYLVNDPLPIEFNVSKDETVKLVPEVLSTETLTPEDFGYTTFSFDIVETFDFLLSVFVYDETAENFELTDAMLSVSANENTIFTGTLGAITNQIKVNDGFDSYILSIEKEAYTSYVDTFTNEELKLYFSSEDKGPLVVILENGEIIMGQPCPGAPTVTDADGNVYPTVQIGDQCWMAENLNVGIQLDSLSHQTNNSIVEKHCYEDNPLNCETYGGLYRWNEMMQYSISDTAAIGSTQGICPTNWHLPTDKEWQQLEVFLGMPEDEANSTSSSRGTDEGTQLLQNGISGFEALLGGYSIYQYSRYLNTDGYYWTATDNPDYNPSYSWNRIFKLDNSRVMRNYGAKSARLSVRCLKN